MTRERLSLLGERRHLYLINPRRVMARFQAISLAKRVVIIMALSAGITVAATATLWSMYERYLIENFNTRVTTMAMEDPSLLSFVRAEFLVSPPPVHTALNLTNADIYLGTSTRVQELLGHMRNGFFVETRARDGETTSNTLALEKIYNWTGLLVEPNPQSFRELELKRRRVYLSPSCLSRGPFPTLNMIPGKRVVVQLEAKVLNRPYTLEDAQRKRVQCFPLYTYLVALGRLTVDYLSLDIYGGELEVLENLPWDRVNIRVLSVKILSPLLQGIRVASSKSVISAFMAKKGYKSHDEVTMLASLRTTVTVFAK